MGFLCAVSIIVEISFSPFFSHCFNSLPNDKMLDQSELKAFADDKVDVTEKLNFVLGKG